MSAKGRSLSSIYRTAFVSGASTGLGQAFSEMLLAEGVQVWGSARDAARLAHVGRHRASTVADESLARKAQAGHGAPGQGRLNPVVLDLADGAAAEHAFRAAAAQAGGFDIVINNAGYSVFGDFAAIDFAHWQAQLEVMLVNTARLAHAALREWRAPAGRQRAAAPTTAECSKVLVNVSSLAAEFPLPYQTSYNVVKAGLSALSESLMIETCGTDIAVIDLRPGDYRTDFARSVIYPEPTFLAEQLADARRENQGPDECPEGARKIEHSKSEAVWAAFERMMQSGPPPAHAARALRRALLRRRSTTLRCGRFFQAVLAPFLARFGSLALQRRVQARYFDA